MTESHTKAFHTDRVLCTCLENYIIFICQSSLVDQHVTTSPLLPTLNGYPILLSPSTQPFILSEQPN